MIPAAGARGRTGPPIALSLIALSIFWSLARRTKGHRLAPCAAGVLAVVWIAGTATYGGAKASASAMSPPPAGIALFPASLDFASQTVGTTTPPRLINVTNIGSDTLNLGSISTGGDFSAISSCGTTLAAGGSCEVAVSFTPTVAGSRSGTLTVIDNASGSPHTVNLVGTGVAVSTGGGATPSGSYSVTVSAVSGTLTHATTVTLGVQ